MATAERPPAKIDGKPNPAYQAWYRAQRKVTKFRNFGSTEYAKEFVAVFGGELEDDDFTYPRVGLKTWTPEMEEWIKSRESPPEPEVLTLRAIGGARNTNYVRAALGNGDAVHVKIRKGMAPKLIGKPIKASVSEEDGEKRYTHVR